MSHFDSRLDMSRRTCARLVMAHVLCSKCRFYGEARVQERKQKLLCRNLESVVLSRAVHASTMRSEQQHLSSTMSSRPQQTS